MFDKLTKILQEKYPKLIVHSHIFRHSQSSITISQPPADPRDWVITIFKTHIYYNLSYTHRHSFTLHDQINITPADPDFFQTIDNILTNFMVKRT